MSDDNVQTSIVLPKFKGAHQDFQTWWTRFLAFARVHQFIQALSETKEKDMPAKETTVIDENTADGKLAKAAKRRNAVAMENL